MDLTEWLVSGDNARSEMDLQVTLLALCLAFVGGKTLAGVYLITHPGNANSRSFLNMLVVMPTLVALVMMVLQDNLATAFGMLSVFGIVRFRNVLSDTGDTTYVLAAIVVGLAAGTQRFAIAVIGGGAIAATLLYLWFTGFGVRNQNSMILNLHWTRSPVELSELTALLGRFARNVECTSHRTRDTGGSDVSYRLLMRDDTKFDHLLTEVRSVTGVSRLSGIRAEAEAAA
jgi:hypothetical protein